MTSAAGLLGGHAHFLHWGVVQISLANLILILLMLVVFALAVVVQLPQSRDDTDSRPLDRQQGPDVNA
jgi:uncharacterized membrane protein